ncbi:MAG: hypothetical protein ACI81T_002816 [Bacteroidia bacterium]|jgi:hypothetical protein
MNENQDGVPIPIEVKAGEEEVFLTALTYLKLQNNNIIDENEYLRVAKKLIDTVKCRDIVLHDGSQYQSEINFIIASLFVSLKKLGRYSKDYKLVSKKDYLTFRLSELVENLTSFLQEYLPLHKYKKNIVENYLSIRYSKPRMKAVKQQIHEIIIEKFQREICEYLNIEAIETWLFLEEDYYEQKFLINTSRELVFEMYLVEEQGYVFKPKEGIPKEYNGIGENPILWSLGNKTVSINFFESNRPYFDIKEYKTSVKTQEKLPEYSVRSEFYVDQIDQIPFDKYDSIIKENRNLTEIELETLRELTNWNVYDKDGTKDYERVDFKQIIMSKLLDIVKLSYPEITRNVSLVIVGIVCAELGLLQREDDYISSDSKLSYITYLRSNISNKLRRS